MTKLNPPTTNASAIDAAFAALPLSRFSDPRLLVGWASAAPVAAELAGHHLPSILIHGPRGSGKTTVLHALHALATDAAPVFVDDEMLLFSVKELRAAFNRTDSAFLLSACTPPTGLDAEARAVCLHFGLISAAYVAHPIFTSPATAALAGELSRERMRRLLPELQSAADALVADYQRAPVPPQLGRSYALLYAAWFVGQFSRAPDAVERAALVKSSSLVV